MSRFAFFLIFAATMMGGGLQAAVAQDFPSKPVRIIVPFGPGQATDTLARVLASGLSEVLTQPVVVENRPGAGGRVGTAFAAKATPDGYTLVMATIGAMAIQPVLYSDLPYEPSKDFAPITVIALTPQVLVASASAPIKTLDELAAFAKASPAGLSYASSGSGSSQHLSMEMLKLRMNIDMTHVPFKGASEAHVSIMAGRTPVMFDSAQAVLPLINSGKLTGIGIAAPSRFPFLPEIPTMAELGLEGFEAVGWIGLAAPAGTPEPVLDVLNQAVREALETDTVATTMKEMAFVPAGNTRQYFAAFIESEQAKWKKVLEDTKVRIE